jgi:hypothetical protein
VSFLSGAPLVRDALDTFLTHFLFDEPQTQVSKVEMNGIKIVFPAQSY